MLVACGRLFRSNMALSSAVPVWVRKTFFRAASAACSKVPSSCGLTRKFASTRIR